MKFTYILTIVYHFSILIILLNHSLQSNLTIQSLISTFQPNNLSIQPWTCCILALNSATIPRLIGALAYPTRSYLDLAVRLIE